MSLQEIFPNPTVKQVIFQIRFPNLFYIENKIGDFQIEIMEMFPESSLLFRKPIVVTDAGSDFKVEDISSKLEETKKIWGFSSAKNYKLHILNNSLDITSEFHKTYDNRDSDNRFRDIIEYVLERFFKVMKVPIIHRVGLRYIDECPLPLKTNDSYRDYYNTAFPLDKFKVDDASEMDFKVVTKIGDHYMRYVESLQKREDKFIVVLDFDAFAFDIKPSDCLRVTDNLHNITIEKYTGIIKEPVLEFMRKQE